MEDIEAFAAVSGDQNPVHLDDEFAKATRFKGRIAHGAFGLALISALLGNDFPGPGTIYLSQSLKFVNPIRPGDTIKVSAEILSVRADKSILILKTTCENQNGQLVLDGEATVLYEPPADKLDL